MSLNFISDENFRRHVIETIAQYGERLRAFDLKKFNANIVDPIKLLFDKNVYGITWNELIRSEIFRQRDKSDNNSIGYFHQKIFQYIAGCTVPKSGWDVVFTKSGGIDIGGDKVGKLYVEIKNKHNTMNSAASAKTYMKMQAQLLHDDDCACMLVEVIAKQSQNVPWTISLDGQKQRHRRIRRVSIDKFYGLVTGEADAFYRLCMELPAMIEHAVADTESAFVPQDTVFDELKNSSTGSFELALYMLGFGTYSGFNGNA